MSLLFTVLTWMSTLAPGRDHSLTATAVTRVLLDEPPLFKDDESRMKTAALVIAMTFRESSFRNDAHSETDDYCIAQIHGRPELAKDVDRCLRVAMGMLRQSMAACGPTNLLGVYATGSCSSERGRRISRDRMRLARSLP